MITIIQSSPVFHAMGWTLLHSIWQIIIVGVLLWILLNFFLRKSAYLSVTFSLGALMLIVFSMCFTFLSYLDSPEIAIDTSPNISSTIPIDEEVAAISTLSVERGEEISIAQEKESSFIEMETLVPFIVVFWMIGILWFGVQFLLGFQEIRRLKHSKLPLPDSYWQEKIILLAEKMEVKKSIQLYLSDHISSPVTFGYLKPIVLFPVSIFTGLNAEQIEIVLLHEVAHIRRSDFLINIFQSIIEVVLFYHPVIWWISRQAKISREHCCDDLVIAIKDNRMLYAETLTQLQATFFLNKSTPSLAIPAHGINGTFTYRIQRLFEKSNDRNRTFKGFLSLGLFSFSLILFAFQQPMSTHVDIGISKNDGMLFVITSENIIQQFKETRQALLTENVTLDYNIDQEKQKIKMISGVITMPDNSTLEFSSTKLDYMVISLDWSRRYPLSIKHGGNNFNSHTEVGDDGSILASSGFGAMGRFQPCILDDVAIGRVDRFGNLVMGTPPASLFLNDLNRRKPLFILDGKKYTHDEIEAQKILASRIFSIIKLHPDIARGKYPSEDVRDGVYEITSQVCFEKNRFDKMIRIEPSVFVDETWISFETKGHAPIKIQIYNEEGKLIETVLEEKSKKEILNDRNNLSIEGYIWKPKDISAGTFIVKILIDGEVYERKIQKIATKK